MTGTLKNGTSYENETFGRIKFSTQKILESTFEQCQFLDCDFSESEFRECRFRECEFVNSNFNIIELSGSRFFESHFKDCKVTGIDWTSLDWAGIAAQAPIAFESCDLSYSVFNALDLQGLKIANCKARSVDFEECNLTNAKFTNTDLQNSRFNRTTLNKCDFDGAVNYAIDPTENSVSGASFDFPEVINLLKSFDIKVKRLR